MNEIELIRNAVSSGGFQTTATYAGYINPTLWNKTVLQFLEQSLVVADKAKVYNDLLGGEGATLNVTVRTTPITAAAVAESADVGISVYDGAQVVFTPTEYAAAFQLTDKQARRAFYDVQMDMARELGYALSELRDTTAITVVTAGTGNKVTANGVASTAIASSDKIDFDDIVAAMTEIRKDKLTPKWLIVSAGQAGELLKSAQFVRADYAGDQLAFRGGLLGKILGMEVFWTTQIAPNTNKSKALMIGVDAAGNSAFGIAFKALPTIRTQRWERGRYTDIVGVEEWDIKVLRANGICTIETYD
jgi:N4-gp56 family major capsid protein